jgi:hypothetical protein
MRGHRTSNYARVMLTSYPYHLRDVGDALGDAFGAAAPWIDKALRVGQAVNQALADQTNQTTQQEKQPREGLKYAAIGLVTVAGVFAAIAISKAVRGSK